MWDGESVSVRDKVAGRVTNPDFLRKKYHSTSGIIEAVRSGNFPDIVMMNFHPQRWTDDPALWAKENIFQAFKNTVKRLFYI